MYMKRDIRNSGGLEGSKKPCGHRKPEGPHIPTGYPDGRPYDPTDGWTEKPIGGI